MKGYESDPDVQLMLRFQRGDESAFDELARRNFGRVLNLVYRFTGGQDNAEDLAQDVFIAVYKARGTYKPMAQFSTWLYKNTLNLCLNYNRSMRLRKVVSLSQPSTTEGRSSLDLPDPSVDQPGDALQRRELQDKVREAISTLPSNQRTAVLLSRFEGLSYKEIADVMDLSVQAVKSLLSRARENLRYKLSFYVRKD